MTKKIVMALGILTTIVALGIAVTKVVGVDGEPQETITYTTKNTDQEIGTEANPYTVLEIVPDASMATIGYLIPGCEPIGINYIADATLDGAADEYAGYYNGTVATMETNDVTAQCYDLPDSVTYPVTPTPEVQGSGDSATYSYYGEYGYYENVGNGNGNYAWDSGLQTFVRQAGGTYAWTCVGDYTETSAREAEVSYWYRVGEVYTDSTQALTDGKTYYHYVNTFQPGATVFQMNIYSGYTLEELPTEHESDTASVKSGTDVQGDRFWCDRTESQRYIYATRNIINNDVLIQNLFPGQSSNNGFCSQVISVTPQQLSASDLSVIDEADMIVIHDMETGLNISNRVNKTIAAKTSFATDNGNDLSWNALEKIVKKQAGGSPAAMILDESAIDPNNATVDGLLNDGSVMSNLSKLYVIMNEYGAKYFYNVYLSGESTPSIAESVYMAGSTLGTNMDMIGASNFVYDFAGDDSSFSTALLQQDRIVKGEHTTAAFINSDVESMSTLEIMKYLNNEINGGTGDIYKNSLDILEIEPCNQFIYGNAGWKEYYLSLVPWFIGTNADIEAQHADGTKDINVTCMTTYQLVGDIEDLSATYDLIIIGATQDVSNGLNGYNDTQLGNLAYTSVGDLITTDSGDRIYGNNRWPAGNLEDEINKDGSSHALVASDNGTDASQIGVRYSGTDLTKKKYEELLNYATVHPVVVDGALYQADGTAVNSAVVDSGSFIYHLAANALQTTSQENICNYNQNSDSNVMMVKQKAGIEHCSIELTEQPVACEYGSNGMVTSASVNDQKDVDDNNVLRYTFTLEGDVGTPENPIVYNVSLYLDQNGNGVYEGSIGHREEAAAFDSTIDEGIVEQATNLIITDVTTDRPETVLDGRLYAGHTYTVVRPLPSVEAGLLPWHLEVYQSDSLNNRTSHTGYTRVSAVGNTHTIKILQMNLRPDMSNDSSRNTANFADTSQNIGRKFASYLSEVRQLGDYDVSIEYLGNRAWSRAYGNNVDKWTDTLLDYDMLILGFNDMACFTNNATFYAGMQAFIASGKSVILSHDMVADASFNYVNNGVVIDEDKALYLRQLSGQMRKYYVPGTKEYSYSSVSSQGGTITMLPDADTFKIGTSWKWHREWEDYFLGIIGGWKYIDVYPDQYLDYDDYTYQVNHGEGMEDVSALMDNSVRAMLYYSMASGNDQTDRTFANGSSSELKSWLGNNNESGNNGATSTITLANEGQITNYPFRLADTITMSPTHAQNYQLDLEYDSGGDVTVWYNLSNTDANGIYSSKEGDSRNNYYIYTKGNITYTGLGHSGSMTDDEIKLFVNTMISAYRSQASDPYVTVTNTDAIHNGQTSTIYIEDKGEQGENNTVRLKVNDDTVAAISRTYQMKVKDAEGNIIALEGMTANADGSYTVNRGSTYSFVAPYAQVKDKSQLDYTVTLESKYTGGNSQVSGESVFDTRYVKILFMPMFDLY